MKKPVIFLLVLLITLFVAIAPALAQDEEEPDLVELLVVNETDGEVILSLAGEGKVYYLAVADGTTRSFTVERMAYDMQVSACGTQAAGTADLNTQLRLRFLPCWGSLTNFGEPTREVVNLLAPPPQLWRLQFK